MDSPQANEVARGPTNVYHLPRFKPPRFILSAIFFGARAVKRRAVPNANLTFRALIVLAEHPTDVSFIHGLPQLKGGNLPQPQGLNKGPTCRRVLESSIISMMISLSQRSARHIRVTMAKDGLIWRETARRRLNDINQGINLDAIHIPRWVLPADLQRNRANRRMHLLDKKAARPLGLVLRRGAQKS